MVVAHLSLPRGEKKTGFVECQRGVCSLSGISNNNFTRVFH